MFINAKEIWMIITRYGKEDEDLLFKMLEEEGDTWLDYHGEKGRIRFSRALISSVTYVISDGSMLCGYVRCRDDDGFGVYGRSGGTRVP